MDKREGDILTAIRDIEHARIICNDSQVTFYLTRAINKLRIALEEDKDDKKD